MKFILLLFAVIGVSYAFPRSARSLKQDFDDIIALIPKEKIKEIYHKYENDEDIKKIVAYLKSEDFAKVVHILEEVEEVRDMVSYLESKGVPAIDLLNKIADILGLPHYPGSYVIRFSNELPKQSRTWRDFLKEVMAAMPVDDILAMVMDKLSNSPDFQELFDKIQHLDYNKLHDNALKHPEIVDMIKRLEAMGVDVKKVWETIKSIFGWEYQTRRQSRSLREDMDELLALIPIEKIHEIILKYKDDPDIVKVIAYLKSDDFAAVWDIVTKVDELQDLITYLDGKKIKASEYINKIADRLGLPHWPGTFARQSRTWRQMMEEIKAVLPIEDITNFFFDKLSNSKDFQELFEKIQNWDYKKLIENAKKHPEIVDMVKRLKAMGVDLDKVWNFIKDIFGWEDQTRRQSRSLREDMDELLALIPIEKIHEIVLKYKDDPDIVKVIAYLKSEDFAAVWDIVTKVDELKDLVEYLDGKKIKASEYINKIADRLGLPHWPGTFVRQSRTWRQMMEEIKAVLPIEDITNFFFDKLSNSKDFQELFEKIQNWDYKKLIENAKKHPEIVDMVKRLKAMGVDLDKVWNFIKDIFGWEDQTRRQSRSLREDMDELLALIPIEKIHEIVLKYKDDPDIVKVIAYLKSEDFAAVWDIVTKVDELQDLVTYLDGKKIKASEYINKIADRLGLPHWPGTFARQSRTWRQMMEEIKAVLPIEDITNFFFDKLSNSKDFQELFEKIQNWDYKKLIENAKKHPEIVDMVKRLKAMGVDLDKVWNFIKDIFGWEDQTRRQSRSLRTDFDELLAIVPYKQIHDIFIKYKDDPDIVKVFKYLTSKDFAAVWEIVKKVDELRDLVTYLDGKDIKATEFINKAADRLGLSHWSSRYVSFSRQSRTWRQMMEEVEAIFPTDEVINFFFDKMSNSEDFKELYTKIQNWDYKQMIADAKTHPEIVDMVNRLKAMGVDLDKVWEFIKGIFEWE